jgi:hypothetical protein
VDPVPDPLLLRKSVSAGNRTRDLWICRPQRRSFTRREKLHKTLEPLSKFRTWNLPYTEIFWFYLLHFSSWFPAWLTLQPWIWRRDVHPTPRLTCNRLPDYIKTELSVTTTVGTADRTSYTRGAREAVFFLRDLWYSRGFFWAMTSPNLVGG